MAALLAAVLGFALVTQVRQTQAQGLESLRQPDLVRILDDVTQRSARLDTEARQLQATRDQLANGSGSDAAALKAARERLQLLQVLAGTVPAHGPGILLTIADRSGKVTAPVLLDALEELRDAGAEAVQIGTVRVVAGSYFADSPAGGVMVDGVLLTAPYVFTAIGDAQTLASAMEIPGGLTETVRQLGAVPTVRQLLTARVDALHTPSAPRYARPVPAPTPS